MKANDTHPIVDDEKNLPSDVMPRHDTTTLISTFETKRWPHIDRIVALILCIVIFLTAVQGTLTIINSNNYAAKQNVALGLGPYQEFLSVQHNGDVYVLVVPMVQQNDHLYQNVTGVYTKQTLVHTKTGTKRISVSQPFVAQEFNENITILSLNGKVYYMAASYDFAQKQLTLHIPPSQIVSLSPATDDQVKAALG